MTLNSNNNVTNDGTIQISNVNNSTGVQIQGGNTASSGFENAGTISNSESFSAATNSNGFTEEPFAQGSGRIGIQVTGTSPFVGNIENDAYEY